ncbi:MAG: hypothetical protein AMXMBFR13_43420 [Phycisphaerae bacterium]
MIFSKETLAQLTFGLIDLTDDPLAKARRSLAFRQGVVSPTITAGEFALTGPAGRIGGTLARNATIGVIFGSGEFVRDWVVEDHVQTAPEFATNTAVFTGGSMMIEGIFLAGGRVIAIIRRAGRPIVVDVTEQVAASAASEVGGLAETPLGRIVEQAQRESAELLAQGQRGGFGGGAASSLSTEQLLAQLPAVSATGDVNLLNVAQRGIPLTMEEASAGLLLPIVDTAPRATDYFFKRIIGDLLKYGRLRGRLGDVGTRVATLNEMAMLETGSLVPRLEFRIRVVGPAGTPADIFADVAALDSSLQPVGFIEFVKSRNAVYEAQRQTLIHQIYPNATVDFVLSW